MEIEVGKEYVSSVGCFVRFWCGVRAKVTKITSRTVHFDGPAGGYLSINQFREQYRPYDDRQYVLELMRSKAYQVWPKEPVRYLKGDVLQKLYDVACTYLETSKLVEKLEKEYRGK